MSDYRPSMGGMRKAYHRWAIVNENVVAPSELDAEFDRFIAKVRDEAKADALREAALMFSSRLGNSYSGVAVRGMLDDRADRIESGDGQ